MQLILELIDFFGFVEHTVSYDCLCLLTLAVNGHLEEERVGLFI